MLYNIGMLLFGLGLKITANFNSKIKQGVEGREKSFNVISKTISGRDNTIWFHCSSLGEYEQGLPVFQEIKKSFPRHKIVLTFFSPSGYEIRKNTDLADVVCYLPIDTRQNAERFVKLLKPALTIFVKYDIWPNYLRQLKRRHLMSLLISAQYRPDQAYFKWYGKPLRAALNTFNHIFVQDSRSKRLLKSINIHNVTISGDTRFDRVYSQLEYDNALPWLQSFKGDNNLIVFGSTWPEDEEIIVDFINSSPCTNCKFLIVPHEIGEQHISSLEGKFQAKVFRFSGLKLGAVSKSNIMILDKVGLLSKAYAYADIAYVGGAMGKTGLHNILEPAIFGIPIIIGKNYYKFPEAIEMVDLGSVSPVSSSMELKEIIEQYLGDALHRANKGGISKDYILNKKGAVVQIMDYLRI